MKVSAFDSIPYFTDAHIPEDWPAPPRYYEPGTGAGSFEELHERLQLMDDIGFDWVSLSEHHYARTHQAPSPVISGAFMAARLERLKIALLGPIIPLNNPVRVAEELATIDNLTRGRLIVGLMRGTPNEYQVFGVKPEEARGKTSEGIELILKAWTEPTPFGWEGRYYQYRTVSIWPRPFQQPMPPTYALGTSKESSELAAQNHLGMGMSFGTVEGNTRVASYYREQCALAGWTPTPEHIIFRCHIAIGETDRAAIELVEGLQKQWGGAAFRMKPTITREVQTRDPRNFVGTPAIGLSVAVQTTLDLGDRQASAPVNFVGSPDTIVKQIEYARKEIGFGVIDFWFYDSFRSNQKQSLKSLKLFGEEVLPRIRDL